MILLFPTLHQVTNPEVIMNANVKADAEEMSSCLVWHNPLYLGCVGKIIFKTVKADSSLKKGMRIWDGLFYVSLREVYRECIDRMYHARGFILGKINVCITWGYRSSFSFSSTGGQKLRQHNVASCCLVFCSLERSLRPPVSEVSIDFGYPTWNSLKACFEKQ